MVEARPYLTVSGLFQTLSTAHTQQRSTIAKLRRQREKQGGFNPWSRLVAALRRHLRLGTEDHLQHAVANAPKNFTARYRALVNGWRSFLSSLEDRDSVGPYKVTDAIEIRHGLTIKINPQLGIVHSDGRVDVVQLYFGADPLPQEIIEAVLYLMHRHLRALCSATTATPMVLDIEHGTAHVLPADWNAEDRVNQFLDQHAERVVELWGPVEQAA